MIFFNINKKKKFNNLYNHCFFSKSQYWLKYQIDNMQIPNKPAKENMMKAFLKNYVTIFRNALTHYLDDEQFDDLSVLSTLYLDTMKDVNSTSIGLAVPKIFIDKYSDCQKTLTDATYENIQAIISSSFYQNNYEKIVAIFDIINYNFILIIINAEETCTKLNGELEKALSGTIYDC